MQNSSPNQSVKLLLASGDVKKVGDETVRGEKTTHYAGTVNVTDLAAKSSHLTASQLADLEQAVHPGRHHDGGRRHLGQRQGPAGQGGLQGRVVERHDVLHDVLQR